MMDRNLARGLFLTAIALTFGLSSLRYDIGTFSHAGPALFPLMVSSLLLLIAVLTIVRSRFERPQRLEINLRNMALLLAGLSGFALTSKVLNMIAGIIAMVFIASIAGSTYSVWRNVKVSAALIAIAYAFYKFLGLNLHLF